MIVEICLSFFGRGAVMRRARQETKALLKTGYDVVVITDLLHNRYVHEFRKYRNRLKVIPIKLYYIPYPFRKVSSELIFALKVRRSLKKLRKIEIIDLIVCHAVTNNYAVHNFTNKWRIPTVFIIQELINERIATSSNPYNWWTTLLYKLANRYAISKTKYFLANSNYIKKWIIKEGVKPENTFVLHNPVDTTKFFPSKNKNKDIDILFVGRLSIEKGVEILIKAVNFLTEKKNIIIVGDGPLRKDLEFQSKTIKNKINFQGWVNNEKLLDFYQRAKILVVPSLSEPQGVVVIEAMACGTPVVGSKVGGIPDMIVHKKNGWLVKPNNPESLGKTLESILSDNETLEKIGKKALETAKNFSEKIFEKRITEFYAILIKKLSS